MGTRPKLARKPTRKLRKPPVPQLPNWPTLVTPLVAEAFDVLRVGASVALRTDEGPYATWYPLQVVPSVGTFEYEHGVESQRWGYNSRLFARACRERKLVRGEHMGFFDLFVPLGAEAEPRAVLVVGPFAIARPSAAEVQERWQRITGSPGRVTDPSFSHYLSSTLATLTLEGSLAEVFERFIAAFARLLGGAGNPAHLANETLAMRAKLADAVIAERTWEEVRNMLDPRTTGIWATEARVKNLEALGLEHAPQYVIVGLLLGRKDDVDPVADLLQRDAFQRACVALSQKLGGAVCGRIGNHGVVFLVDHGGSWPRVRTRLTDLATRAQSTAKRFGFKLFAGVGHASDGTPLPTRYRAALSAAEQALSHGKPLVFGAPRREPSLKHLRALRNTLAESMGERPDRLSPRFERYVEAVLVHCGYRLEPTKANLDAGLERLAEPLLKTGALDEKSFDDLCLSMERSTEDAQTITALVAPYRRLVSDMEAAMQHSTSASQDRSTQRALEFIREHLGETLSLSQVARVAGFAPGYFSKLFKQRQGATFEDFVRQLRIARAKQLLAGTSLNTERVGKLCGFRGRSHFHRTFKKFAGLTPLAYRDRAGGQSAQ